MRFEWIPTVFSVKVMRTITNALPLHDYINTDYKFLFAHTYGVTLVDIRNRSSFNGIPRIKNSAFIIEQNLPPLTI